MTGAERREKILDVAAFIFAEHGYDGATTQTIARQCGISEPLLYRHFASKAALYRAVLRRLIRYQNERFATSEQDLSSIVGYVRSIRNYLTRYANAADGSEMLISQRLMMASLAGDGIFAKLMYRRALRQRNPTSIEAALKQARAEGHAEQVAVSPTNSLLFLGYIGAMLTATLRSDKFLMPYAGERDTVIRDALIFCTRGMGISDRVVVQMYEEEAAAMSNASPIPSPEG